MRALAVCVSFAIGLALSGCTQSRSPDESKENKAAQEPRPAELKPLEKLVGTWGSPTAENPKAMRAKWTLGKTHLQIDHQITPELETMTLITWDKQKKVYRAWWFTAVNAGPQESTGTWDEKTQTFTFADLPDASGTRTYVLGADNLEFLEKLGGFSMECKYTRVKE